MGAAGPESSATSDPSPLDPNSVIPSGYLERLKPGPCVEPWVAALNALEPSQIEKGFDVTGPEFDGVQAQCPFAGLSERDRVHVFGRIEADVRTALQDAGFIQFVPTGTPINN